MCGCEVMGLIDMMRCMDGMNGRDGLMGGRDGCNGWVKLD